MKILIQRVLYAKVSIGDRVVSEIEKGCLLFVGVGREDTESDAARLAKKIVNLRIFDDAEGKMNINVIDAHGALLSVSQFTLFADTKKGNRPGFDRAAPPELGEKLWNEFNARLREEGVFVTTGVFGARMSVELLNDGPVTILLDSRRDIIT